MNERMDIVTVLLRTQDREVTGFESLLPSLKEVISVSSPSNETKAEVSCATCLHTKTHSPFQWRNIIKLGMDSQHSPNTTSFITVEGTCVCSLYFHSEGFWGSKLSFYSLFIGAIFFLFLFFILFFYF